MSTELLPPSELARIHQGSCLCGGIRFTVSGALPPIQVCHCGQCRRAQGGPFATNVPIQASQLHWLGGEDLVQVYDSSDDKQRCFCRRCGSPLFSRRASLPGVLRLRAGLLDGDFGSRVGLHMHWASRAPWWADDVDGTPHHEAGV